MFKRSKMIFRRPDPVFLRLLKLMGRHWILLSSIILLALLANGAMLMGPWLIGRAIDQMAGPGQILWQPLSRYALVLLALYTAASLFQWLMGVLTTILSSQVIRSLRYTCFDRITQLPLKDLDHHSHGDWVSRLTQDLDALADGLLTGLSQAFSGLVTLVGSLIFMLMLNPWITLIILALTPASFKLAGAISRNARQKFREQSETAGELSGLAEEMIGGLPLVRAFGYQEQVMQRYAELNNRLYVSGQKAQFYSSLTNPTTRLINHIAYLSVAILASILAIGGRLTVGSIASFLAYATQFAKPINEVTGMATQLQSAIASARRVFELADLEIEDPDDEKRPDLVIQTGEVVFQDVSFSYHIQRPLIEKLNLQIKAGQMVAIVGPTGAGKTTLVNLLLRFYPVSRGRILIDGQDISQVNRDSLRRSFGMVLQESWLFTGTVHENIAFGRPDAGREAVEAAARAASAHSFIRRLPQGYDTVIGPDSSHLSQGQQQLLTIARAFLCAPPLLVLDEATSNVDTGTEIRIQQAMKKLQQGRTSFIIAHRLSTIREADIILVMDHGQIVEQGTHRQLLQKNGRYAALLRSQFAGAAEETGTISERGRPDES
ncbi:MAG: ABC transporter ATP-binding protein [Clostridiaceae bacterium]|nr:ABC transporter ATP-binding protein [Clostridiaceae bacterium]